MPQNSTIASNIQTLILVSSIAPGHTNQASDSDESDSELQLQECTHTESED